MTENTQQNLTSMILLVKDYDEALTFYTQKLGFELMTDEPIGKGKRWLKICPKDSTGLSLVLKKATTPAQQEIVGRQAADGVLLILQTSNFWLDYQQMQANGVTFLETPREEAHGIVAIFADLYGNQYDLLQPAPK